MNLTSANSTMLSGELQRLLSSSIQLAPLNLRDINLEVLNSSTSAAGVGEAALHESSLLRPMHLKKSPEGTDRSEGCEVGAVLTEASSSESDPSSSEMLSEQSVYITRSSEF